MPNYYSDQPFQNAYSYLDQGAQNAMPSEESRDRAYARVRSRLSNERSTRDSELGDQYAGRGLSNSGALQGAQERSYGQYLSNYGSSLAQVEDDYEKRRQEGAKTLGDIGSSYGSIASEQAQRGIDQGIGDRKLNIEDYSAYTDRLRGINDIFTSFGTVGGALGTNGSPQTGAAFDRLKAELLRQLGLTW